MDNILHNNLGRYPVNFHSGKHFLFCSTDKKNELLSMDKDNPRTAADMLVSYVLETNNLKAMVDALYVAGKQTYRNEKYFKQNSVIKKGNANQELNE